MEHRTAREIKRLVEEEGMEIESMEDRKGGHILARVRCPKSGNKGTVTFGVSDGDHRAKRNSRTYLRRIKNGTN